MFTVCFAIYASLSAVHPTSSRCHSMTEEGTTMAIATCYAVDRDPLRTCESRNVGAKWFITIRNLNDAVEPAVSPTTKAKGKVSK